MQLKSTVKIALDPNNEEGYFSTLKIECNTSGTIECMEMVAELLATAKKAMELIAPNPYDSLANKIEKLRLKALPGHGWNKEEATALLGSIEHWKRNEIAAEEDRKMEVDSDSCDCCILAAERGRWHNNPELFQDQGYEDLNPMEEKDCSMCPVGEYTRQTFCQGTPYDAYDTDPTEMRVWLEQLYCNLNPPVTYGHSE